MADEIEKICPICGKRFGVLHPDMWVYKKQKDGRTIFFCRYTCYRTDEKKEEEMNKQGMDNRDLILTVLDNVEVGHNAAETLSDAGYKNVRIGWGCLMKWARKNAPDLVTRMEKVLIEPSKKAEVSKVDTVPPVQCIQHVTAMDIEEVHEAADANRASFEPQKLILRGGVDYKMKVDEAAKPEAATNMPGFRYKIKTIETDIGDFSYDAKNHILTFERKEEFVDFGCYKPILVMTTQEWDKLLIIVPQLADLMGVTL